MTAPNCIQLTHVGFCYNDSSQQTPQPEPLLSIPKWSVAKGERVFIHGASGTGKSTLLHLLMGLLVPKQGNIQLLGQRLDQMSARQRDRFRAQHMGCIFQQFNLIPYLNALENVALAEQLSLRAHPTPSTRSTFRASLTSDTTKDLLSQLKLSDALWHRPVSRLSVGQQQRVSIARALIHRPRLILADEPTSALDPSNTETFMTLLHKITEELDATLVFVSHDPSLASDFDRTDRMAQGQLQEHAA